MNTAKAKETNPSGPNKGMNGKKYRHYIHSPFTLNHAGVKVDVDEHGKIVLTQEQTDGFYKDEITCSAGLINKISQLLFTTRKEEGGNFSKSFDHSPFSLTHGGVDVEVSEHGQVVLTQEQEDESYDEITCPASLINKISQMLFATRKIVWRDKPFKEEDQEEETN